MRLTRRHRWTKLLIVTCLVVAGVGSWRLFVYLGYRSMLHAGGFRAELDDFGAGDRILIVAPHPDDEVLGCGGLIQKAVCAGAQVFVAVMTSGDASELSIIFGEKKLPLSPQAFIKLGSDRQKETLAGVGSLGIPADHVHFLGFPNDGLLAMWQPQYWSHATLYTSPFTHVRQSLYPDLVTPHAPYCGRQVLSDLTLLLRHIEPTAVFVTHPQDIHPDHWATEAFVCYALEYLRAQQVDWALHTRLYGYLVHWPCWPLPRDFAPHLQLLPPPDLLRVSSGRWLHLPLTNEQAHGKAAALHKYRSQAPGYDSLLRAMVRTNEAFAALTYRPLLTGNVLQWPDEINRQRKLGGADVLAVRVTREQQQSVTADIQCRPKPVPKGGYVALDLRTWDHTWRPVIVTAYLTDTGPPRVEQLTGAGLQGAPITVQQQGRGRWRIGPLTLPDETHDRPLLVGCWGSVADTQTDPAFGL